MVILLRLAAMPRVALKRIWAQKWMTLITILGLTLAVALFMTVPIYSDGVNFRILEERLSTQTENRQRPPFAYLFTYVGTWYGSLEWDDIVEADAYMLSRGSLRLGMPRQLAVRHFESNRFEIFAPNSSDSVFNDPTIRLGLLKFGASSDFFEQIKLVEGRLPADLDGPLSADNRLEVLINRALSDQTGYQPGERYSAFRALEDGGTEIVPIEIAGIWEAKNFSDPYWVYNKDAYEDIMFIDLESFETRLAPQIEGEINLAAWYFVMDGSEIGPNQIDRTIVALRNVERRLQTALPEVQTLLDPTDALTLYRRDVGRLNQVLFAFNLPTIGLVLTFIGLIGRLWTDRLRSELAVMRSRGSSVTQLMGTVLVEALIIGAISYGLGILVSLLFSSWMGRARSFLDFSSESGVRVQLSNTTLLIGLAAAGIALLAQLLPTLPAAQQTIVSYKLIQARHTRPPWWQRAYLDFILLAMSLYGIYLVQQDGELISLAASAESDPFQNPLLLLLPALLIYAVTLLILRLLPWTMHQISRLLQLSDSVALLQAARYLARSSRSYATPFILLVLTVSFAIYTASLARTLDFHLYDQLFYQSGADINLFTAPRAENNFLGTTVSSDPEAFLDLPMSEYESLTGVNHATRVGQYPVEVRVGTDSISGEFYGLDRTTFGNVGYWRWDFSRYRLGSLLNGLGAREEGLIISRSLMRQTGLRVGETIQLTVSLSDQEVTFPAVVTGTFEQFPTWYPNEGGVLVVGNLDYLYDIAGNTYPYRVWLDTGPILDETDLRLGLNRLGLFTTTWIEPHSAIQARLERPERQGLFGLLSVGFVAATALTILGLGLYALFSYRQRVVELGILRAVGLPAGRMVRLIAWELALLLLIGLLLGSCLGITVSQLFIPSLQVGVTSIQQFPPMVVELSLGAIFQVYLFFGLLFILAFSVLALVTMRMRLFVAIKLGETI